MNRVVWSVSVLLAAGALAAPKPKGDFVLGGTPANGQVTFKTYCNSCHGDSGAGDGPAAVSLNPKPANFTDAKHAAEVTDEYIYKMVKDGGAANGKSPYMVAWGPMLGDDAKVRDVAAYVRSLSKHAEPAKKPTKK
jgi:mono/diheme cytochrome c family protein